MNFKNKHYAKIENGIVKRFFSDAFEQPTENDICIDEDADRHCYKQATNENNLPLYEVIDGEIVERDLTEDTFNFVKNGKLAELNQAYNQYILSQHPIEKQLKMTMEYNALLNIQINETLTTEQADRKIELEDLHRWYKGMLMNHETDKAYILSETDIEKLKSFTPTLENS